MESVSRSIGSLVLGLCIVLPGAVFGAPPPCHTISGYVYNDANNNGLRVGPPTEPGIPGSQVELRNVSSVVVAVDTTDLLGFYEFPGDSTVPAFLDQVETASVPTTITDWSSSLTVPQFDPSLGTLLSAKVELLGSLNSQVRVENTSAGSVTIKVTVQGDLVLTAPNVSLTKQLKPLDGALFAAAPFDGVIDFAGTSGHDFGLQTATDGASATLTNPVDLAPYIGVGTVPLTGEANNVSSTVSGGGGIVSTLNSTASGDYTVTYHYAPFNCLDPGGYTIVQVAQPGGFADGFDTAGNVAPIPGSNTTDVIPVTLVATDLPENNFGELVPTCLVDSDCNDGNVCTTDTCDISSNACVYTPNANACDDGNACTTGDVCSAAVCGGTTLVCSDGDPCNGTETCNILTGCEPGVPLVCDDSTACNGLEVCVPGTGCQAGDGPFLVDTKIAIGNFCTVGGTMGANALNGSVRLGRGSDMPDDTRIIGNKIIVGQGASAFRVEYNTLRLSQNATVRNSSSTPAALPIQTPFCPIPAVFPTCNSGNGVSVGLGASQTLNPGVYGTVNVLNQGTLTFEPGSYVMCSFRTVRAVHLIVNGPGPTTIDIVDGLQFGNLTIMQLNGAPPPTIRIAGKKVKVSTDSQVAGFVSAPNASFNVGHNAKFTGSFCSAKARVANGSDIICQ